MKYEDCEIMDATACIAESLHKIADTLERQIKIQEAQVAAVTRFLDEMQRAASATFASLQVRGASEED